MKIWQIKIIQNYHSIYGEPKTISNGIEYKLGWTNKSGDIEVIFNMNENRVIVFGPPYSSYIYYDSGAIATKVQILGSGFLSEHFLESGEKVSFSEYLNQKGPA